MNGKAACACGASVAMPAETDGLNRRELACRCGRLYDLEPHKDAWLVLCVLTPEGSVPVTGFSRELRATSDVRRYWFAQPISPAGQIVVHIVFSPSLKVAEIKAADQKPARFEGVETATEARRQWLADRPKPRRTAKRRGV